MATAYEIVQSDRQAIAKKFIENIQNGYLMPPESEGTFERPYNPVSDAVYKGGNHLRLTMCQLERGYRDNRWLTFNQAKAKGWQVKRGAQSVLCEKWITTKEERYLDEVSGQYRTRTVELDRPCCSFFRVFNAEDIEGIPPRENQPTETRESISELSDLLYSSAECPVYYDENVSDSYYSRVSNCVYLSAERCNRSAENEFDDLSLNIIRSTAHQDRLNRKSGDIGSVDWAKEELRAELGAYFLKCDLGADVSSRQYNGHTNRLENWVAALDEDYNELFRACADADRAAQRVSRNVQVERDRREQERFEREVDAALEGTLPFYTAIKVCDTPKILLDVGCEQLPMLYTQSHLQKAVATKNDEKHHHGISAEQIKNVPRKMKEPMMIFDSFSQKDSIVVVLNDFDNSNNPIITSIKPNGTGRYELEMVRANYITSIYSKNNFMNTLNRVIADEHLIYCDKKQTQEMFERWGLQSPELTKSLVFNTIIHKSRNIVKPAEKNSSQVLAQQPKQTVAAGRGR